jgi:hypothetical protein
MGRSTSTAISALRTADTADHQSGRTHTPNANLGPRCLTVTVGQAAAILGLSTPSIWALLADGRLESININKRRLVLWTSIEELVESRRGVAGDARRNACVPPLGAKKKGPKELDLATPVKDLELSTRATNALINDGVLTLQDLVAKTDSELLLIPNLGRGSLAEIKAALVKRGLREKDVADSR